MLVLDNLAGLDSSAAAALWIAEPITRGIAECLSGIFAVMDIRYKSLSHLSSLAVIRRCIRHYKLAYRHGFQHPVVQGKPKHVIVDINTRSLIEPQQLLTFIKAIEWP